MNIFCYIGFYIKKKFGPVNIKTFFFFFCLIDQAQISKLQYYNMTSKHENMEGQPKLTPAQWKDCAKMTQKSRPPPQDFSSAAWTAKLKSNPALKAELAKLKNKYQLKTSAKNAPLVIPRIRQRGGKRANIANKRKLQQQLSSYAGPNAGKYIYSENIKKLNHENYHLKKKNLGKHRVQ